MDEENLIKYWDSIAGKKEFTTPVPLGHLRATNKTDRIVEVGCGYGRVLGALWSDGFTNLAGCDPSAKMVALARERLDERIEFEVALFEIARILKPGGLFIVNDFLLQADRALYDLREDKHGQYGVFKVDDSGMVKHMSRSRLSSILGKFRIEEFNERPFVTMNGTVAKGAAVVARRVSVSNYV